MQGACKAKRVVCSGASGTFMEPYLIRRTAPSVRRIIEYLLYMPLDPRLLLTSYAALLTSKEEGHLMPCASDFGLSARCVQGRAYSRGGQSCWCGTSLPSSLPHGLISSKMLSQLEVDEVSMPDRTRVRRRRTR